MASEIVNNSSVICGPSQKVSKEEGKDFKYNENGRRYHDGKDDVAYILPNDDDGMYQCIQS